MNVSEVIDDDYKEIERIGVRRPHRPEPAGDPRQPRRQDGVHLQHASTSTVTVHDADTMRLLGRIKVCEPPKSPEWVRGQDAVQHGAAADDRAGAGSPARRAIPTATATAGSGTTPRGCARRRLLGLAHTHPLHWSADRDEVQDFEYTIRGRLMQGRGLLRGPIKPKVGFQPDRAGGKDRRPLDGPRRPGDLQQLVRVHACRRTSRRRASCRRPAERGKSLFFNKTVGCAQLPQRAVLHRQQPDQKPFKLHDVGTGNGRSQREDGAEIRHADPPRRLPHGSVPAPRQGEDAARGADHLQQGGQARQDQPAEARRDRRSGRVSSSRCLTRCRPTRRRTP